MRAKPQFVTAYCIATGVKPIDTLDGVGEVGSDDAPNPVGIVSDKDEFGKTYSLDVREQMIRRIATGFAQKSRHSSGCSIIGAQEILNHI